MAPLFPLNERRSPAIAVTVVIFLSVASTLSVAFNVTTLSFNDFYAPLFGDFNILRSPDDKSLRLLLDKYSGSGFTSKDLYHHGLFSASIKLPSNYTAGVVVAFYTSNGDVFEKTHDELDFEFLGNIRGKEWRIQTNVYGNGSTNRGREERYLLWFDPSKEFHRYSILWTSKNIIFYIDDIPIREVVRTPEMGLDYPSKPMQLYATIWDGSPWATSGGRYKANYAYAPFVSEFTDLVLKGCAADPIQLVSSERCTEEEDTIAAEDFATISPEGRAAMRRFRLRYMTYSHCYDRDRYPSPMSECILDLQEQQRFKRTGHLKFSISHRRQTHHRRRSTSATGKANHRTSYV